MAFVIQLYNNISEPERIGKALSPTVSFTGSLKDQTSIINPTIIVDSSSVPSGNYARIDAFGRYYFITDKDEKFTLKDMPNDFRHNPKLYKIMKENIMPILETNLSGITPEEMEVPDEEENFYDL